MIDFFIHNYYAAYMLVLVAVLFAWIMSVRVNGTFKRYSRVMSRRGVPAYMIAKEILMNNGIYDIDVVQIAGNLTDHYDPKKRVIALSQSVYNSTSVGAIGVAAHEVGHAIQHNSGYVPIKLRSLIFPVAQIGSYAWIWLFIIGTFLNFGPLILLGIIFFVFVIVFQLVTLPVEFNASKRALTTIKQRRILMDDEIHGAKKVLSAAAMTYVASLMVSIAQLLRLLASFNRRR